MKNLTVLLAFLLSTTIINAQPPKKVMVKPGKVQLKSGKGKNKTQVKVNTKSGKVMVK